MGFYFFILMISLDLATLHLSYYSDYYLEHRFALSTQNITDWWKDQGKSFLISLILGVLFVEILYWMLRTSPELWWAYTAMIFTLIFIVMANLAPVVLMPIFFTFTPLKDERLRERLLKLSHDAGTSVKEVYEMDLSRRSKTANAALAGLGNTRRIILSDTLIQQFSGDEIEVVLAHELGHHKYHHIWKLIAVQTVVTIAALYATFHTVRAGVSFFEFRGVEDIASLPLILLIITLVSLFSLPLANLYSRRLEYMADHYALGATGNSQAFITAMEKLAKMNLAEIDPHPVIEFLFFSHPSIQKRIEHARGFLRGNQMNPATVS
ncbi:MAG: M48 family metallopeptidase [Candidatus Tectomicrobia bacterium]|nr:M48 family metallopeptidase [Candidatus Tectomicrobia bacterium]